MKIAYVLDDSLDRTDGVQQYVLGLGNEMAANGHKVFYLVGETTRTDIPGIYPLAKLRQIGFNGNVVRTPLPVKRTDILSALKEISPDILHVQLPFSPLFAARVVRAAGKKVGVVGTFHVYPDSWFDKQLNGALTLINSKTVQRFNRLLAVSPAAANASGLVGKRRILLVPNHVNLERYFKARSNKDQENTIVFLGRLVPRKGCQQLLLAVALLKQQGRLPRKTKVIIGGDGPLLKSLKKQTVSLHLQNIVTFMGFIPEKDKAEFLANASAAVFPSRGGESFGIVLIEAMAAGSPVLAGDNPGYAGVLGEKSKQLFPTHSPQILADKLALLLDSKQLRKKVVGMQDKMLPAYDIAKVSQQIERQYAQSIARYR